MSNFVSTLLRDFWRCPSLDSLTSIESLGESLCQGGFERIQNDKQKLRFVRAKDSMDQQTKSMYQAANLHYRVLQESGRGSISRVFFAMENKTSELIAVKVKKKNKKADLVAPSLEWSIYIEIFTLEKLRHPNIVKILDAHEDDKHVFVKTPFCSQGTLNDRLALTCFMDEERALKITKCLLGVLQFLHKNGVAHRDIRPECLLFDATGTLKLCNFGLAHIRTPGDRGRSKIFCGAKPYAAPEIMARKEYNPAIADTWSAGAVLFYMLTKRQLFSDSNGAFKLEYNNAYQEDVSLEMLDLNMTRRSKRSREILIGLLQVNPKMRKSIPKVMDMCDDALRDIQVAKLMKKCKMNLQLNVRDYGISDIENSSSKITGGKCGPIMKKPSKY